MTGGKNIEEFYLWRFFKFCFVCLFLQLSKKQNIKIPLSKLSEKGVNKFNVDNIRETLLKEIGLIINELTKIEGYKNYVN